MANPVKYPPDGRRFGLTDAGFIDNTLRTLCKEMSQETSLPTREMRASLISSRALS